MSEKEFIMSDRAKFLSLSLHFLASTPTGAPVSFRVGTIVIVALLGAPASAAVDIKANSIGKLTSVGNAFTRTYNEYDEQGRVVATQYVQDGQSRLFTTEFGYSQNPDTTPGPGTVVVAQVFPDGERTTYTYDTAGRQERIRTTFGSSTQNILRNSRTNARGQITLLELGNNTQTVYSYDDGGHLGLKRAHTTNAAGRNIQDYTYLYDDNGNVSGIADGVLDAQSVTFEYDSLDQLTTVYSKGTVLEQYDYDTIGNLVRKGALFQSYGTQGRPHALDSSNGISYGYDPNGNVTRIGGDLTIDWNSENMPRRVVAGSKTTEKSHVGESLWKKVEDGVTTYYLPSMRLENGAPRKFYGAFAERLEPPGDRKLRFYHPDHLGSSSVMTDENGEPIRRVSYMPWGQDRAADQTFEPKLQFNFKEKDANGLYDYGARLYSPVTGRWLSPDSSLADGLNRYAYVQNNPVTRTDPTGHQSQRNIWIICYYCHDERTGYIGLWPSNRPVPKGWQAIDMSAGYYETILDERYSVLLPDGTMVFERKDSNWSTRATGDLHITPELAERAITTTATENVEGEAIMTIANAVRGVPKLFAAAMAVAVIAGTGGGVLLYAGGGLGAGSLTTLGIEGAPSFSATSPSVFGAQATIEQFRSVANVLANWSRWTPGVNVDRIRMVLQSSGPVLVVPGGGWTQLETQALIYARWAMLETPYGILFFKTAQSLKF
jgi:RHS repeat-associated protein